MKTEVIGIDGEAVEKPQSAIEQLTTVEGYNDLVRQISRLGIEDDMDYGDGKTYYPNVGKIVWQTVVMATKPMIPSSLTEKESLSSIYKVILAFTKAGEYPLLQQLCNYLGMGLDDFFAILRTQGHPNREVYLWAYNVFEAAASMNAIRSNGNSNARMWIDKSRENKISAETKIELAIEASKVKQLEDYGAEVERSLIEK